MEGTKMNKEIYYWESNMGALQDILNAGEDKAAIYYIGEAVKKAQVPMEDITSISVVDDGSENDLAIEVRTKTIKFERIRRITGYLVGSIDRWNDAKKAEERERVKHIIEG